MPRSTDLTPELRRWDLHAETDLLAAACKESFWLFLKHAFGVAHSPRGRWLYEPRHRELCRFLETFGKRWLSDRAKGNERETHLMVNWPRDTGKTVVVTKAFPIWLQLHDPDLAVALGSATRERSISFLQAVAAVLEGKDRYARFSEYYGVWHDPTLTWQPNSGTLVHGRRQALGISEPSFGNFSVETGATAYHPDVIVLDDPITKEKMRDNANWLQIVNEHLINLIPVLKRGGLFLYVGTPYHDGDAIHTLWREEGVARFFGTPPVDSHRYLGGRWNVFFIPGKAADGTPNFPTIWTPEKMERYERRSPQDFAAQVLLEPATGAHMPFQRMHLDSMWISEADIPRSWHVTLHMDTAFKKPDRLGRGDDNVIVVAFHATDGTGKVAFGECIGSNRWQADQMLEKLVELVQRYRKRGFYIRCLTDEEEMGGKAGIWRSQIRNRFALARVQMPIMHLLKRQETRKIERITDAAGHWASGTVQLVRRGAGLETLISQMLRIGQSQHDDYADAAADAFHELVYNPAERPPDDDSDWVIPERPYDDLLKGMGYYQRDPEVTDVPIQTRREPIH